MAVGIGVSPFPVLPAGGASSSFGTGAAPPVDGWAIPFSLGSGGRTLADPRPPVFLEDGVELPVHGRPIIFERIHVIPRRKDFGAVLTDQELLVEVWNAFRWRAQTLEEITIEGPAGIEVENPDTLPVHYPATESKLYVVRALAEGDPLIDNVVTWIFTDIDPQGTDLTLTGFRLVPWPFEPNMGSGIVERYGYATEILQGRSGAEQRIQMVDLPRGSIKISNLFDDPRECQEANAILYGSQARPIGVPRWQYRQEVSAAIPVDSTEILVNTTDLPFFAGGLVFIYRNARTWEAQRIAEVLPDRLVLDLGARASWPAAGTWVVPLVFGRLPDSISLSWLNLRIGETTLEFDVDSFKPDPATASSAPDGLVGVPTS
jgi:hypothetical protein